MQNRQVVYDLHRPNNWITTYQTKNKADAAALRDGGKVKRRVVKHGKRDYDQKKRSHVMGWPTTSARQSPELAALLLALR